MDPAGGQEGSSLPGARRAHGLPAPQGLAHPPPAPAPVPLALVEACSDPVPGEALRAPPGWRALLQELDEGLVDASPDARARAERAATVIAAHRRRWREQDAIAAELRRMLPPQEAIRSTFTDDEGRELVRTDGAMVRLDGEIVTLRTHDPITPQDLQPVVLRSGRETIPTPPGRWLPKAWAADVRGLAGQLGTCRRSWAAVTRADGSVVEVPSACGSQVCPVCSYERRAATIRELLPQVEALILSGCSAVFVTNTQRTRPGDPGAVSVAVSERERRLLGLDPRQRVRHGVARPVPGETLGEAWDRLDRAVDTHRRSTGQIPPLFGGDPWSAYRPGDTWRDRWRREVVAEVVGVEVTGFAGKARRGSRLLRYHAHAHRLVILAPGVDPGRWAAFWRARWIEVADAGTCGQHHRVIAAHGARVGSQDLRTTLAQVLKYPGKLDTMTAAQRLDFYAAMKGRRPYRVRGMLHGGDARRVEVLGALVAEDDLDDPWGELSADGMGAVRRGLARAIGAATERELRRPRAVCSWATRDGDGRVRPVTRSRAATWTHDRELLIVDGIGRTDPQDPERLPLLGVVTGIPRDVAASLLFPRSLGAGAAPEACKLAGEVFALVGRELGRARDVDRTARARLALLGCSFQGRNGPLDVGGEGGSTTIGALLASGGRQLDRGVSPGELRGELGILSAQGLDGVEGAIEPRDRGVGHTHNGAHEDVKRAIVEGRTKDGRSITARILLLGCAQREADRRGGRALPLRHEVDPGVALASVA